MKKKKVIILQLYIPEYRVPVFSKLAEIYDLTVVFTKVDSSPENVPYKRVKLEEKIFGPFVWVKGLYNICRGNDVVIYSTDLHYVNYCFIPLIPSCFKTISYGVGIRASYKTQFNLQRRKKLIDYLYKKITYSSDSVLVYFKEVLDFWNLSERTREKCFETRNTVEVISIKNKTNYNRKYFLFVGSLYKEKEVDKLIIAYNNAYRVNMVDNFPSLIIIGNGSQIEDLKSIVAKFNLGNRIIFKGAIYDESEIANYFEKALICISPNQAGLSVPHSMGYGVPFVTIRNAITGGEILHIKDGYNGILMNNINELENVLTDVHLNRKKYLQMGDNAFQYYNQYATIDRMVNGIDDAIKFALR